MNLPLQILLSLPFIPRFFLSLGSYALDAWLASNPARVVIWVGVTGSTQPYMCHNLGGGNLSVISM